MVVFCFSQLRRRRRRCRRHGGACDDGEREVMRLEPVESRGTCSIDLRGVPRPEPTAAFLIC